MIRCSRLAILTAPLLLCVSLSACFSVNKPVQAIRYSLPVVAATNQPAAHAQSRVVLAPIQLADYLDTDRIILQIDDITLQPTRDHLWADSLSQELRRSLRARLTARLPATNLLDPQAGLPASTPQLRIRIDQFQGHLNGYAILSGQWQLAASASSHPFRFTTPLTENGYPALVRALGHNLDVLVDEIAPQIDVSP